jgi:RNA polymerase sigma-70 factor (ECF subfamily)
MDPSTRPNGLPVHPDRAPAGTSAEFERVYREHFAYVFHSLRRLGVRPRELEDVTHDVFLAICRRFSDYDPGRPVRPWLFGFAYRIAADHRRLSRHRHEGGELLVEPHDERRLPDELLAEEQVRKRVLDALERIDLERRALLIMHDLDGHAIPEIAQVLSIPLNTAYSRLRLARRDFRAALQRTIRAPLTSTPLEGSDERA